MNKQFYTKVGEIEKRTSTFIKHYQKVFYRHLTNDDHLKEINLVDTQTLFEEIDEDPGIYYFEARFQPLAENISFEKFHKDFTTNWNELGEDYKYPKFYKTNAKHHFNKISKGCWVPFYLGKRKKLKNRVMEHILGHTSDKTYAMRLTGRKLDLNYRVSFISLKELGKEQYFLVELFEKELRKQLKPIIGKQ
jgi:hypothetical protein